MRRMCGRWEDRGRSSNRIKTLPFTPTSDAKGMVMKSVQSTHRIESRDITGDTVKERKAIGYIRVSIRTHCGCAC
jgi:hypothetical protein